jgi:endonuclease/exonuclease/phosphatase family metal-dependent hydrolase
MYTTHKDNLITKGITHSIQLCVMPFCFVATFSRLKTDYVRTLYGLSTDGCDTETPTFCMIQCFRKGYSVSDFPSIKIDYIFVSRDLNVQCADIPEIISSDHRPHIATIEWEP